MLQSPTNAKRPSSKDGEKNLWSSLLNDVSRGRKLPEKTVFVVGGSPELQKDFLDVLDSEASRRPQDRHRQKPPVANDFAMGFTYQDVLDADQEDILARLSIYTLPEPPDAFASLAKPLLTAKTVPESLIVLLLDWAEPWNWIRQVRDRLRLVQRILGQLDAETQQVMDEIMQDWQQRRRGPVVDGATQAPTEPNVKVPLGPGEWDEALGLPLCVVCHGIEKMDALEKEYSWREEDFDYVLQFLRTVLLKHGGSLVYTANTSPNSLPSLIQSTLGIQSVLKRNPLKHNVVDREKILIPPNWDSWGKIKIIRESFDVEEVSNGWSLEIQPPRAGEVETTAPPDGENKEDQDGDEGKEDKRPADAPTRLYETRVQDLHKERQLTSMKQDDGRDEVKAPSMQEFLSSQQVLIEQLKQEDEAAAKEDPKILTPDGNGYADGTGRVNEHIGPVQFNMGGIQIDADSVLQQLRRGREETPELEMSRTKSSGTPAGASTPAGGKSETEHLATFFAGLLNRGSSASPRPPAS